MTVAWIQTQNFSQQQCALIANISNRTVRRYLSGFEKGGLEWLREIRQKGKKSNPLLEKARKGHGHVFFCHAVHLVLGSFLCSVWSEVRRFVRSSSGRQRFNLLGAWNAITHQFVSVCNTTVVNKETFCELLEKIAALGLNGPITLVLDNARYQHCAHCIKTAKSLGIELLFLPPYSPNLNLIERIWKFIRKKALYGRHFSSFANFRLSIENCVAGFDSIFKDQLDVLMALNFQTFENERTFLSA